MLARPAPPRLVLISSLAVYGYASMPAWSQIDETTPLEPDPELRDAYCRAKLAQEALARFAAQRHGLKVWTLRPGAIVGAGRERTSRLGFSIGPTLFMPGGTAPVPLIDVETCAAAILQAAMTIPMRSDYPVVERDGCFEAINLVGLSQPSQTSYANQIAGHGWPRQIVKVGYKSREGTGAGARLLGCACPRFRTPAPGTAAP